VGLLTLVGGVLALTGAADVDSLQQLWTGVRDSTEQVVVADDPAVGLWPENSDKRVRVIVQPVALPWLGSHVLYFEEFLHDDPDNLRRQLLVKLEPAASHGVRAQWFTFVQPRAWLHLHLRPNLLERLSQRDVVTDAACDLLFLREGEQFRGATSGRKCVDVQTKSADYIDYQVLVGQDLYWYRRRAIRKGDGEVEEEIIGFNYFELNSTQLYTCRIDWTATGQPQDLRPLLRLDLQDQGGHGRFTTPDGRRLELTLHSDDWPFAAERDALILEVQDQGAKIPSAIAWASVDEGDVQLNLDWLRVRCGPVVPDNDELLADAGL
jgi:hypothetical protein